MIGGDGATDSRLLHSSAAMLLVCDQGRGGFWRICTEMACHGKLNVNGGSIAIGHPYGMIQMRFTPSVLFIEVCVTALSSSPELL